MASTPYQPCSVSTITSPSSKDTEFNTIQCTEHDAPWIACPSSQALKTKHAQQMSDRSWGQAAASCADLTNATWDKSNPPKKSTAIPLTSSVIIWDRCSERKKLQKTIFETLIKLLYFELSPPWHLYVLLLAGLLAHFLPIYVAYLLAFDLAFYLTHLLVFYLANSLNSIWNTL